MHNFKNKTTYLQVKYDGAEAKLNEVIASDKATKNLYYAATSLTNLGKKGEKS